MCRFRSKGLRCVTVDRHPETSGVSADVRDALMACGSFSRLRASAQGVP